jgi:glycosyltransferase involved in cell wall biosynthesis
VTPFPTRRSSDLAWIISGFAGDEKDNNGAPAILNLARELSLSPVIELDIFSFYYPLNKPHYKFHNANVFSFSDGIGNSKHQKIDIWNQVENKFNREHKKRQYDLIHSIWSGEPGYIAARIARKNNVPLVTSVCGGELAEIKEINYGSRLKFFQKKFVNKAFKEADKIIVSSDFIKGQVNKYYKNDVNSKITKIPFGIEHQFFYPDNSTNGTKNDFPVLLNIANAVPVKNHILLFKAFEIFKKEYPDSILKIYGRDENNYLKKLASDTGLQNSIFINGFVDYELIPEIINSADIFILTSYYESQNAAALEAGFCGVPVIGTNTGIIPEITENVVNSFNPGELAKMILKVAGNINGEKKISLDNIKKLISKFSLGVTTEKTIHLYKLMMAGK